LRARAPEVTRGLIESYGKTAPDRYFRRWALLETLREVSDKGALSFVARLSSSPIPPERIKGDPERSSADEEVRIRIKAVEVLAAVASQGVQEADEALLRLVRHADRGIRRTAIRGYLAAGRSSEEQARRGEVLRKRLPKTDYGLITLDATDVKQVPHPAMPEKFDIKRAPRAKN